MTLRVPRDMDSAHACWGASCGHGALASILGVEVEATRALQPKPWTTPTAMKVALEVKSARFQVLNYPLRPLPLEKLDAMLPERGLVFVQFGGPWLREGVPVAAAYKHTHWIATEAVEGERRVYDANLDEVIPFGAWAGFVAPEIARDIRRCDGTWFARMALRVPR